MLKLERLARDPSRLSRLSNRHIVALTQLSAQVGPQGRFELDERGRRSVINSRVRIDLTIDPEAVRECAQAGLALMEDDYVTVSPIVQEALAEWLCTTPFTTHQKNPCLWDK
jgi:hypothetical protein